MAIEKLAGVIALGALLYWIFKDAAGTSGILLSLAGANRQFTGNLQGNSVAASSFPIFGSGR